MDATFRQSFKPISIMAAGRPTTARAVPDREHVAPPQDFHWKTPPFWTHS